MERLCAARQVGVPPAFGVALIMLAALAVPLVTEVFLAGSVLRSSSVTVGSRSRELSQGVVIGNDQYWLLN